MATGLTCTENFVKFGRVVSEIRQRTDRHTDMLITVLCTPQAGGGVKIINTVVNTVFN